MPISVEEEQRMCIQFCSKLRKNSVETYEMLKIAFGDKCISRTSALEWFEKYEKDNKHLVNSETEKDNKHRLDSKTKGQLSQSLKPKKARQVRSSVKILPKEEDSWNSVFIKSEPLEDESDDEKGNLKGEKAKSTSLSKKANNDTSKLTTKRTKKLFHCPQCQREYKTAHSLKKHVTTHCLVKSPKAQSKKKGISEDETVSTQESKVKSEIQDEETNPYDTSIDAENEEADSLLKTEPTEQENTNLVTMSECENSTSFSVKVEDLNPEIEFKDVKIEM